MLRLNKPHRVFRGTVTTSGKKTKLSVSVSNRDQQTGEWSSEWWTVYVDGVYPCEKEDEVKFTPTAITAISQSQYKGQTYYNIFADGSIEYKGATYKCGDTPQPQSKGEVVGKVDVTEESLPF